MWLPLGKLSSGGILNANIKLENIGDLCSYAKVKLTPKGILFISSIAFLFDSTFYFLYKC